MKKIPIDKASAAQLAAFARLHLGLEIEADASAAKIRAAMAQAAYDKDYIEAADAAEPAPRARAQAFNAWAEGTRPDTVTVLIQSQPGPGGDEPVFVGVNGSAMFIERGKPQEIRYPYYEALKHAVAYQYDPDDKSGLKPPRAVPAYPFSVLSMG